MAANIVAKNTQVWCKNMRQKNCCNLQKEEVRAKTALDDNLERPDLVTLNIQTM